MSDEVNGNINKCDFFGYCKMKMCKHLVGLHNVVSYHFPKKQLHEVIVTRGKNSFQVQDKQMDFDINCMKSSLMFH